MDKEARAILSRANLGETIYSSLSEIIWNGWLEISARGDNATNHPRPVLAALCEMAAESEGIRVETHLIEKRFNVSRSYKSWLP